MNEDLIAYYNSRAKEYEKVYLNPDEQEDLHTAATLFQQLFAHKTVLEIACGTGYWTAVIAQTASAILATDINQSVIDIAKARKIKGNVIFEVADMYNLPLNQKYEGVFGGFIWSHILLQDLDGLLDQLQGSIVAGGTLILIDSNQVASTNHDKKRITKTDEMGNTFQTRTLEDGTAHVVLKNFPTEDFLFQKLSRIATDIEVVKLTYYWIASCKIKRSTV